MISAVWCLLLFSMYRGQQTATRQSTAAATPGPKHMADRSQSPIPWRSFGLGQTAILVPVILGLALILFFMTPRHGNPEWQLGLTVPNSMRTGMGDGTIDLTGTGKIKPNNDVALEVYAEDAQGKPKNDLDLDQRWRCTTLTSYDNGRWPGRRHPPVGPPRSDDEINFGPQQYFLTIDRPCPCPPGWATCASRSGRGPARTRLASWSHR